MLSVLCKLIKKVLAGNPAHYASRPTQSDKPLAICFQGIDCKVSLHRITPHSYGIGLKTDMPLNTKYMHSIQRYLESEGFIDTFLAESYENRN
jgi:hypothetical protein